MIQVKRSTVYSLQSTVHSLQSTVHSLQSAVLDVTQILMHSQPGSMFVGTWGRGYVGLLATHARFTVSPSSLKSLKSLKSPTSHLRALLKMLRIM